MPKVALADTLFDWESLLVAATEKGAGVPGLEVHLAKLRAAIAQGRELDALRQRLQAERQKATQDLAATRLDGDDLAIRIRELLVATFGPRAEELVQFGVQPLGRRRRSAASRDSKEPAAPLDR